jgi:hypothetical protein
MLSRVLTRQVLRKHDLPSAPSVITVREHLVRTVLHDVKYLYGLEEESPGGASSHERAKHDREDGEGTDDEGDKHTGLYEGQEYDLFADGGKAPVGAGKLPM